MLFAIIVTWLAWLGSLAQWQSEANEDKTIPMKQWKIVGNGGASKKKHPMIRRLWNIAYNTMDSTQAILIEAALANLPKTTKRPEQKRNKIKTRPKGRILNLNRLVGLAPLITMSTMMASQVGISTAIKTAKFDAESKVIGIDNRASKCISRDRSDFVGPLKQKHVQIHGYSGISDRMVMEGTIRWRWMDDIGRIHEFPIPNSVYNPQGHDLLSPQHWARHMGDSTRNGTGCKTTSDTVTLFWKANRYKRTLNLTKGTNVADLHTAPSYNDYRRFLKDANNAEEMAAWEARTHHDTIEDVTAKEDVNLYRLPTNLTMLETIMHPFHEPTTCTSAKRKTPTQKKNKQPLEATTNLTPTQAAFLQAHKNVGHIS